ncbi:MAG: hypothetical protein MRY49_00180 [Candidatus Pacebacteria bacterium]|nr:hypothetical protein [Candidatus Paceibacterota bacterium]
MIRYATAALTVLMAMSIMATHGNADKITIDHHQATPVTATINQTATGQHEEATIVASAPIHKLQTLRHEEGTRACKTHTGYLGYLGEEPPTGSVATAPTCMKNTAAWATATSPPQTQIDEGNAYISTRKYMARTTHTPPAIDQEYRSSSGRTALHPIDDGQTTDYASATIDNYGTDERTIL